MIRIDASLSACLFPRAIYDSKELNACSLSDNRCISNRKQNYVTLLIEGGTWYDLLSAIEVLRHFIVLSPMLIVTSTAWWLQSFESVPSLNVII